MQFIPIVVIPQVLLGGFFWPLQQMAPALRWIAQVMPMTYAIQALKAVMVRGQGLAVIWPQLLALLGFTVLFFLLAAFSVQDSLSRTPRGSWLWGQISNLSPVLSQICPHSFLLRIRRPGRPPRVRGDGWPVVSTIHNPLHVAAP